MSYDLDLLKDCISALGITIGTISGIGALFVEFRDKQNGGVTKWGRYAVMGLIASFILSSSNVVIEHIGKLNEQRASTKKAQEDGQKTLQIVTDIRRTLNPIKDANFSFTLYYSYKDPEIARYRERLDAGVRELLPRLKPLVWTDGVIKSYLDPEDALSEVIISDKSSLFPNEYTERLVYDLFTPYVRFYFFKKAIDFSKVVFPEFQNPDLQMGVERSRPVDRNFELIYNINTKEFRLSGTMLYSPEKYWTSSGEILSVLDMPGVQLAAEVSDVFFSAHEDLVDPVIKDIQIGFSGRNWRIPNEKLKFYKNEPGHNFVAYTFPHDYESLRKEIESKFPAD